MDSWVQAESGLKSGLTLTSVGLTDSDSDSDPLDSDSDSDSGLMDSDSDSGPMDSDSHLMDSDSGLMDSDSDSDSDLVDSDSLPDSRVRTHSNTAIIFKNVRFVLRRATSVSMIAYGFSVLITSTLSGSSIVDILRRSKTSTFYKL